MNKVSRNACQTAFFWSKACFLLTSSLTPLFELFSGAAYRAHPADAALAVGRRFAGATIVVVGGGGTSSGWTQRVRFGTQGSPALEGTRSCTFRRGSQEWGEHLLRESRATCGWALLVVEQQWQAAVSPSSAASLGGEGVERMLRVRDAVSRFGDDRIAEDAVRAAIDHPTMEGSIVGGVRGALVDSLQREAEANGLRVAGIRISVMCLLERYLARLHSEQASPSRAIVAYDGQSALIVTIRDGAFDTAEGGISYLVNRSPAEVRTQVARRLTAPSSQREWNGKVDIIGATFSFEDGHVPEGVDVRQESDDLILAAVDDAVRHDLRPALQEVRPALPQWIQGVVFTAAVAVVGCIVGAAIHVSDGARLSATIKSDENELALQQAALARARGQIARFAADEGRAKVIGEWVDKNFHAQHLAQAFLSVLPVEVSLDAVSVVAVEGLPQARLKFTMLGSEAAQRGALRAVESRLYHMGYEVGKREDPTLSTSRRGAIVYVWDLILPSFGS